MSERTRQLLVVVLSVVAVGLVAGAFYVSVPRPSSVPGVTSAPMPSRPAAPPPAPAQPKPAEPAPLAPDFTLERLDGSRVTLSSLRGRVVVVDFWATWCPPCRAEMPWLVELGKRLEPRGISFVAIDEDDPPGQRPLVQQFAQQVPGLERFAVLGDPVIEARYGVESLPTLFIIDRQGRIVDRFVGQADEGTVLAAVTAVAMR